MKDAWKNLFFYLLFLLIILSLLAPLFNAAPKVQELSFTEFLTQVDAGKVSEVSIGNDFFSGKLTTGGRAPGSGQSPSYIKPVPRMLQRG